MISALALHGAQSDVGKQGRIWENLCNYVQIEQAIHSGER